MSVRAIKKPRAHPQKKQQLRVLFAEDDPAAQLIVRTLLEKHGYVTAFARNGCEALARFQAEPFDLVLTDVHMPEMDGFVPKPILPRVMLAEIEGVLRSRAGKATGTEA